MAQLGPPVQSLPQGCCQGVIMVLEVSARIDPFPSSLTWWSADSFPPWLLVRGTF